MAGFHNTTLPASFGYGSGGSSMFSTDMFPLKDGREQRNQNWAGEKRKFNLSYPIKDVTKIISLRNFFRLRAGMANGFLFEDPLDNSSLPTNFAGGTPTNLDQIIGVGNGVTTEFQLKVVITDSIGTFDYLVYKPTSSTLTVAVAGVAKTLGVHYTLSVLGKITFGTAPASGNVTAGFRYKVPVRFDTDEFFISYDEFNAFQIASLPTVEIVPEE